MTTKSIENSTRTKIHFQNLLRPSPTLFIRHWNEEKLEDMKVGTETFYSFIQSMIHKLDVYTNIAKYPNCKIILNHQICLD